VTAFVRNPQGLQTTHVNLSIFKGDLFDPQIVNAAVKKHAVVISALGVKPTVKDKNVPPVRSEGTKNIIAAMKQQSVKRLLVISSQGVGDSKPRSGLFGKVIVPLFLKNRFAEVEKQERLVLESGLDWTIVRPPRLTKGPLTETYKVGALLKIGLMDSIARADVSGEVKLLLASFPENEWLAYHPAKIVFNASPNATQYAAVRFDNDLYDPHSLQDFEAELRRENLGTALLEPQPVLKPKIASPRNLTRNYIIWMSGLVVFAFLALLAKRMVDQRTDFLRIVEQFFKAAGFVKADKIAADLLWLHPRNGQVSALAYLYQKDHYPSPKMAAIYERFQTNLQKAKLYLIHDDPLSKATIQGIRDELNCETVPLPASIIRKAVAAKRCRQKLHELEEAFHLPANPYFFDQPNKHPFWFYGREEILHRLPALLAQGQHVWLCGLPKIGKTTLAYQLRLRLSELPTVFIDFQIQKSWEGQVRETLQQMGDELRWFGIKQVSTVKTDLRQSLLNYSDCWQRSGRREPILFVIDGWNFPPLQENTSQREDAAPFLQTLLELAQSRRTFVLLVIGTRPDPQASSITGNDSMQRFFHEEYLECLTPPESLILVHEMGRWRQISWEAPAAERVFYFCGGHPFVTRWFAGRACQDGSLKRIDLERVDKTAQEIQASLHNNELGRFYHSILTSLIENERQLLDLIGQQSEQGFSENTLPPHLQEAADNLETLGLVANDVGRLSLTSHLFKSYLQFSRIGHTL